MKRLDEDEQAFYTALAARAEAEDYGPIEQAISVLNGTSTTAEELDSLVRELLDSDQVGDVPWARRG